MGNQEAVGKCPDRPATGETRVTLFIVRSACHVSVLSLSLSLSLPPSFCPSHPRDAKAKKSKHILALGNLTGPQSVPEGPRCPCVMGVGTHTMVHFKL